MTMMSARPDCGESGLPIANGMHRSDPVRVAATVAWLLTLFVSLWLLPSCTAQRAVDAPAVEQVTLERVVDGDTIIVDFPDGESERVRLIGIDAPESVHPDEARNTQEGVDASDYLKGLITPGQTLYLEKDVSDCDKYDRLLRYVWLNAPTDGSEEDVAENMLNAIILESGHAVAKRYPPDTKYADVFERLQAG